MNRRIRSVRKKERGQIPGLYDNAYHAGLETTRNWIGPLENTRAIVEEGRIVSMLQITPFRIWVGGREVTMGGIGGVATRSDRLGKGYAAALMADSVRRMREMGLWTSGLYPFSYAYYRKFGWELCAQTIVYEGLKRDGIAVSGETDPVRLCPGGERPDLLDTAYRNFARGHNCCVVRTRRMWAEALARSGEAYLIGDRRHPTGYFLADYKPAEGGVEMVVRELACSGDRAYGSFFKFLSRLPAQVDRFTVHASPGALLWKHFKEPFACKTVLRPGLQFRVVDVRRALEARGFPEDVDGSAVFSVRDEFAPWNRGPWRMEISGGRCGIKKSSAPPDFDCSIQTFSELYSGFKPADGLAPASAGFLTKAFSGRIPLIFDRF
jgi:predicted acetyltransferase